MHSSTGSIVKVRGIPPLLWNKERLTRLSSVFHFQCNNGDPWHYDKLQQMQKWLSGSYSEHSGETACRCKGPNSRFTQRANAQLQALKGGANELHPTNSLLSPLLLGPVFSSTCSQA